MTTQFHEINFAGDVDVVAEIETLMQFFAEHNELQPAQLARIALLQEQIGHTTSDINRSYELFKAKKLANYDFLAELLRCADAAKPLEVQSQLLLNPPAVPWLIPNLIMRNTVTILSGRGGLGKSTLVFQIAMAVAAGEKTWLLGQGENNEYALSAQSERVAFFSWEDDLAQLSRIRKLNQTAAMQSDKYIPNWHYVHLRGQGTLFAVGRGSHKDTRASETPLARKIKTFCVKNEIRVLVFDTLASIYGSNENEGSFVKEFLDGWIAWAEKNNVTVIIVAHPSKSEGSTISGHSQWRNAVRSLLHLDRHETGEFVDPEPPARKPVALTSLGLKIDKQSYSAHEGRKIWLSRDGMTFSYCSTPTF